MLFFSEKSEDALNARYHCHQLGKAHLHHDVIMPQLGTIFVSSSISAVASSFCKVEQTIERDVYCSKPGIIRRLTDESWRDETKVCYLITMRSKFHAKGTTRRLCDAPFLLSLR